MVGQARRQAARTGEAPLLRQSEGAGAAQAEVRLLGQVDHARARDAEVAHQLLRIAAAAHARLGNVLQPTAEGCKTAT